MRLREPTAARYVSHGTDRTTVSALLVPVLLGLVLRVVLLCVAENQLDCDESVVAFMGLDVLEGRALPLFFYGNAYNGGAALEAYLVAVGFRLFGFQPAVVKAAPLLVWLAAALVVGDVCRRVLSGRAATLAVAAFCLASPFQLEWSLKARGGFVETVLVSSLLLWLLFGPQPLRRRRFLASLLVGLTMGVGWWVSEMLLPLTVCVAFWMVFRERPRRTVVTGLALGALLGLSPLIVYNVTYHWANVTESVVYGLLADGTRSGPLSARAFFASVRFAFGPVWWLVCLGLGVACWRLRVLPPGDERQLASLLLVHTMLYFAAYWLAGLRALPIAPSRVLLAVYPGVAILLGIAADWSRRGRVVRMFSYVCVGTWVVLVLTAVVAWAWTGRPREQGSWRGMWSLADGQAVYRILNAEDVEIVYTNYWTAWPLALTARAAGRDGSGQMGLLGVQAHVVWVARQPGGRGLVIQTSLPRAHERPRRRVAVLVVSGSRIQQAVEQAFAQQGTHYERTVIGDLVLITGLSAAQLPLELDAAIDGADAWPALPEIPDGFN